MHLGGHGLAGDAENEKRWLAGADFSTRKKSKRMGNCGLTGLTINKLGFHGIFYGNQQGFFVGGQRGIDMVRLPLFSPLTKPGL